MAGRGLGEDADVELVEEGGHAAVDLLAAVVGEEGPDGVGDGRQQRFEAWDEEVLGDARHSSKVLELHGFVDDVDELDAPLAVPVAEMHGVDAEEAGLAVGAWLVADPDGHGSGPDLAEGEAAGPVGSGPAEVVGCGHSRSRARRAKRSSPYTSCMRRRMTLTAGPEGWPKASSISAAGRSRGACRGAGMRWREAYCGGHGCGPSGGAVGSGG